MTHLWRKLRRWLSDMGLVRAPIGYDDARNRLFFVPHSTYFTVDMYPRATMHRLEDADTTDQA